MPPLLYSFRRCPYAMRARLALLSSGIRCEIREIVLRDKPTAMLAASPKGTVPVLITEAGEVLAESLDIMLWALGQNDPENWLRPQHGTLDEMLALIAANDRGFKLDLDRYKYPERYPDVEALIHRESGAEFLMRLEKRLEKTCYLFGAHPALADMAIAPFVRQFAHTDKAWFAEQDWPRLRTWLDALLNTASYATVMTRYASWQEQQPTEYFPPLAESTPGNAA